MSRNLCQTDCYFCGCPLVADGEPELVDEAYARAYARQYAGRLWGAPGHCPACLARYLLWYNYAQWPRAEAPPPRPGPGTAHVDTSFLSSFNDEPGPEDVPRWEVRKVESAPCSTGSTVDDVAFVQTTWVRVRPWRGETS